MATQQIVDIRIPVEEALRGRVFESTKPHTLERVDEDGCALEGPCQCGGWHGVSPLGRA